MASTVVKSTNVLTTHSTRARYLVNFAAYLLKQVWVAYGSHNFTLQANEACINNDGGFKCQGLQIEISISLSLKKCQLSVITACHVHCDGGCKGIGADECKSCLHLQDGG
jgi:hypothetical protein